MSGPASWPRRPRELAEFAVPLRAEATCRDPGCGAQAPRPCPCARGRRSITGRPRDACQAVPLRGGHVGLTGVILDAPVPCPSVRSFRGEWPRELARPAVLRRATSTCVERESGWGSGDARRRRTWGIPTVAGEREAWVFDRGWRGRSNVALLPACVADLRSQGVAVVKWTSKVACPSGRRCSTRNAVWCNSHPGFKSLRYRV